MGLDGVMNAPSARRKTALWLAAALLIFISACAGGPGPGPTGVTRQNALEAVPPDQWPILFDDLGAAGFREACRHSLDYLGRIPPNRVFTFGPLRVTAADMIRGVRRLSSILEQYPDPVQRTEALKQEFTLLRSVGRDGRGQVLFTGYYEPILKARRAPSPPYVHPLYALPDDLVTIDLRQFGDDLPAKRLVGRVREHKVTPFPEREAIDFQGAIKDTAQPLAYLADPVEAFFLHIQGSGQVLFPDGQRLRLGFAGVNGRPYRSIGKLLLKQGLMERSGMSMQGVKRFLAENPQYLRRVLSHNPSYVFFRPLPAQGGPIGCYGIPVTGGRSIATDRRVFPGLAVAYIQGTTPAPQGRTAPLARFVLNQDTGGAIRGPGRLDLFYGSGPRAGALAGRMKYVGRLFFLAPRTAGE